MDEHALGLPPTVQRLLHGYTLRPVAIGKSTARTFRLEKPGNPTLYLKVDSRATKYPLSQERGVLEWLGGKLPAPKVIAYVEDGGSDHLLMTAVQGVDAATLARAHAYGRQKLVRLLAQGLRHLHSLSPSGCPFDQTLAVEIEEARRYTAQGMVDEQNFDDVRLGRTAEDLFQELLRRRPEREDLVFTHGDYCLPNVIIQDGRVMGFVDWGRGGMGDRYKDLALALRSIQSNLGDGLENVFLDAYGTSNPDWDRIDYFQLLDELF
jgi:aminoglycoside phosphotransferase